MATQSVLLTTTTATDLNAALSLTDDTTYAAQVGDTSSVLIYEGSTPPTIGTSPAMRFEPGAFISMKPISGETIYAWAGESSVTIIVSVAP